MICQEIKQQVKAMLSEDTSYRQEVKIKTWSSLGIDCTKRQKVDERSVYEGWELAQSRTLRQDKAFEQRRTEI